VFLKNLHYYKIIIIFIVCVHGEAGKHHSDIGRMVLELGPRKVISYVFLSLYAVRNSACRTTDLYPCTRCTCLYIGVLVYYYNCNLVKCNEFLEAMTIHTAESNSYSTVYDLTGF